MLLVEVPEGSVADTHPELLGDVLAPLHQRQLRLVLQPRPRTNSLDLVGVQLPLVDPLAVQGLDAVLVLVPADDGPDGVDVDGEHASDLHRRVLDPHWVEV